MTELRSARNDPLAFIAHPTPQLSTTIDQQRGILADAEFDGLIGAVRSAFDKYTAKLQSCLPGTDRAIVLHQLIDRELAPAAQFPISCRKGCVACCHYEVEITRDEADLLTVLALDDASLDRNRLRLQAARERKSPDWLRFGHPENRCVFLGEDGACRVYDHRPASCRKLLVTTPPEACGTPGASVVPIQLLLIEIILSAALSLPDTVFASLPKLLAKSLEADPVV